MRTVLVFSVLLVTLLACSAPATREASERDSAADVASSDGGASEQSDGSVAPKSSLRAHDAGASSVTLPARDAGAHDASTRPVVDAGEIDAGAQPVADSGRSDGSVEAGERDAAPAVDSGVDASVSDDAGPTVPACSGAVAASLCMPVVQCSDRFVCSQSGGYGCCEAMQVPFCKCD